MSRYLPIRDAARPNAEKINSLIRRLMGKPASRKRTAEYERLLTLWAEAHGATSSGRHDEAPPKPGRFGWGLDLVGCYRQAARACAAASSINSPHRVHSSSPLNSSLVVCASAL